MNSDITTSSTASTRSRARHANPNATCQHQHTSTQTGKPTTCAVCEDSLPMTDVYSHLYQALQRTTSDPSLTLFPKPTLNPLDCGTCEQPASVRDIFDYLFLATIQGTSIKIVLSYMLESYVLACDKPIGQYFFLLCSSHVKALASWMPMLIAAASLMHGLILASRFVLGGIVPLRVWNKFQTGSAVLSIVPGCVIVALCKTLNYALGG